MKLWTGAVAHQPTGMPPMRGHDLKRDQGWPPAAHCRMPPMRGHDLKLHTARKLHPMQRMPPMRGHDLKLSELKAFTKQA